MKTKTILYFDLTQGGYTWWQFYNKTDSNRTTC